MSNPKMFLKDSQRSDWDSKWWSELSLWYDYLQSLIGYILTLFSNIYAKREFVSPFSSSGELSNDTKVRSEQGIFGGLVIATDGVNDVTARVYDDSVKILPTLTITGSDNFEYFPISVKLNINCVVKISGDGGRFMVIHKSRTYE